MLCLQKKKIHFSFHPLTLIHPPQFLIQNKHHKHWGHFFESRGNSLKRMYVKEGWVHVK